MYDFVSYTQGFLCFFFLTTILFAKIHLFSYFSIVVAIGCRHRSH